MESFVKWGNEKRQLNEILGTAAVTIPTVGAAIYLWKNGRNKKDSKSDFWVFKRDAEKGDQKKVFDGPAIIGMYDEGILKDKDLFIPQGAQNWMKIGDAKNSGKFLPWSMSKTVGKAGTIVDDNTKWVAIIDGKRKTYEGSPAFAKAISSGEVDKGTHVWHDGYGQKWKKYGDKDVDDDIAKYVAKEIPSLGDTDIMGAETWYGSNGNKNGPIEFMDLATKNLQDDNWVWVKGVTDGWVRFKEVKNKLPRLGQAHVSSPRGLLGQWMFGKNKTAYTKPDDAWKKGRT